ncbi:hypothetical protein MIND_00848100 [Mycena indigotica]|uniref:ABM domain-containing protein n=1 Tax=Mycena indigotica TaxID=2126181 RepID=A0A8H6SGK0_9AGAR|nr:uncharacterized protein MIND_00848100 [Mycena indigotica]KAF7298999.1 hypothetical protein MIND_00848100 [Mycena indigotica]
MCVSVIALALTLMFSSLVDFPQCFANVTADLRSGNRIDGFTDNNGVPTTDPSKATAITYQRCLESCGGGGGAFSWSSFSQQFSAWLLPWLALLSQFPFGCKYKWDNLMSVFLALGSPCLAAYSLALTVLNTKWVIRRFKNTKYPNNTWAAIILSGMQQMALKVTTVSEDGYSLLASLVVLQENDQWWEKVEDNLNYADLHTWSIASVTSIAWVILAYALTVVDAFTTISTDPNSNGQGLSGVGSIWLWMIPVTIGYLQLSPRCDAERVSKALREANRQSFVMIPGANGLRNVDALTEERALSINSYGHHQTLYSDQEATAPIYNYARFLPFIHVVEEVASAFEAATKKAHLRTSVSGDRWEPGDGRTVHPENRRGTADQIERYCAQPPYVRRSHWGSGVLNRFFIAAIAGLTLQWSSSGASILIVYYTPTVGLGCRSAAYLVYAGAATLVWILLVISSFLVHYATPFVPGTAQTLSQRIAGDVAIFLRRSAKVLATLNAVWILVAFLLQFANFYDRCYCNSDVIGLGKRAHNVMLLLGPDISNMKAAWVGGIALAVSVSGFWSFYGPQVENKETAYFVSVWKSYEDHAKLIADPSYKTVIEGLRSATTDSAQFSRNHIDVSKDPLTALSSPAVEFVLFTLKNGEADADKLVPLLTELESGLNVATGAHPPCVFGQSREDKSKFLLVVGWDTVEAHWEAVKEGTGLHTTVGKIAALADLSIGHSHVKAHE